MDAIARCVTSGSNFGCLLNRSPDWLMFWATVLNGGDDARNTSNRDTMSWAEMSGERVNACTEEVFAALGSLKSNYIQHPMNDRTRVAASLAWVGISPKFSAFWGVLGATDGVHVPIIVGSDGNFMPHHLRYARIHSNRPATMGVFRIRNVTINSTAHKGLPGWIPLSPYTIPG